MLLQLIARLGSVVLLAALCAAPIHLWLERRHRPRWPSALGEPEATGGGAYRSGEIRLPTPGRAPAVTRAVAFVHLVAAGVCTWEGPMLGSWMAAQEGLPFDRFLLAMVVVVAALCLASPIFILSARRLLRRDPGLVGAGVALGACAGLGAAAMLAAGTMRLPREVLASMESLWLEGALNVVAVELCAMAFWVGARAAVRATGA
jgi:hypothetical protein